MAYLSSSQVPHTYKHEKENALDNKQNYAKKLNLGTEGKNEMLISEQTVNSQNNPFVTDCSRYFHLTP